MKPDAVLVNMARGPIVNGADLYQALEENMIGGAALDVLEQEPIPAEHPLGKFQDSSRLLITPHMAWAAVETRRRVLQETCENIRAFLRGEDRNRVY